MTPTTPPPLQAPSAKEKRYDRQLRLWAAAGQAALEKAHVLLINSGAGVAGVEALKNMVLPGKSAESSSGESLCFIALEFRVKRKSEAER